MREFPHDIESRVHRYLDGELTPQELLEFNELLGSSEEVRDLVREFELIRSTARAFPRLTAPDPTVESGLFQMLFVDDEPVEEEENRRRAALVPLLRQGLAGIASTGFRRAAMALPVVLLLFLFAEDAFDRSAEEKAPAATSRTIAQQIDPDFASPQRPWIVRDNSPATEQGRTEQKSVVLTVERSPEVRLSVNSGLHSGAADGARESSVGGRNETDEKKDLIEDENAFAWSRPTDDREENSSERAPTEPDFNELFAEFEDPRFADNRGEEGSGSLSASYRHGVATFIGAEENVGQEMNLRIDGELSGGHRVSLSVGSSPLLVSERTFTLRSGINEKGDPEPASVSVEDGSRIDDEFWAGIGYGYRLFEGEKLSLEAGVSVGLGTSTARYGVELPARVSVTDRIDLEIVPSLTRITSRDEEVRARDDAFDPNRFGEEWTPSTTSIGLQAGISLSLGR